MRWETSSRGKAITSASLLPASWPFACAFLSERKASIASAALFGLLRSLHLPQAFKPGPGQFAPVAIGEITLQSFFSLYAPDSVGSKCRDTLPEGHASRPPEPSKTANRYRPFGEHLRPRRTRFESRVTGQTCFAFTGTDRGEGPTPSFSPSAFDSKCHGWPPDPRRQNHRIQHEDDQVEAGQIRLLHLFRPTRRIGPRCHKRETWPFALPL